MLKKINSYLMMFAFLPLLTGCGEYNAVFKSQDYDYKYEAAKAFYVEGHYAKAAEVFGSLIAVMKGSAYGEECMYMLALSNYMARDYESSAQFFKKYYQSYPKGHYVELARYYSGYSLYKRTADVRLDQSSTVEAITEFNTFLELYPNTVLKDQTQEMIYTLQDKLVEKEYLNAKMYFDLGTYRGNSMGSSSDVSNYEACVVTAENALKDYPYATPARQEELSILILRSRYQLAKQSIDEKRVERFRDVMDEYYAFVNDYPESKYLKEANGIFIHAESIVKRKNIDLSDED